MNLRTLIPTGTLAVAGLVAGGLLAMPGASTTGAAADDRWVRDEDTPDVVLVADDDDDDTNDNTRSRSRSRDNTGTGAATGRDDSRDRRVKDWTQDGPGAQKRDWSARHTNDRSRRNTRR